MDLLSNLSSELQTYGSVVKVHGIVLVLSSGHLNFLLPHILGTRLIMLQ